MLYTVYEEDGARELADKCICVSIEVWVFVKVYA